MSWEERGAFAFGLVIGWFLYFLNRYRRGDVSLSDISTVLGAVGGAAVTSLFGGGAANLFASYGIGLATGFFGYLVMLFVMVLLSKDFDVDYFLDGRRNVLPAGKYIPGDVRPPAVSFDAPPQGVPDQSAAIVQAAVTAAVAAVRKD